MKRVVPVLASLLIAGLLTGGAAQNSVRGGDDKEIKMPAIKLKDLLSHIAEQKGKVVVVDLWGFFCVPCKEEFPNLVRMHHAYGSKGLVCISLSLDFNDDLRKKAVGFLQEKKAVFKNYWLVEGIDGAQKHWNFEPVPVVAVYGRDGKIAKVFNNDDPCKQFTYKDVEPFVKQLLDAK